MNYFAAGSISCRTGYMQSDKPDKDQLLREALPFVRQTLQEEFTVIPVEDQPTLLKTTLRVYEHTLRIAQKKSMNLPAFARRVLREQAHVWLLRHGQTREQKASENWVWDKNEASLKAYLRHFSFRTNDVIADLTAQTFKDFFQNMRLPKPLETLLQFYLIKMAKLKALHELRSERKVDKDGLPVYLKPVDQTFIDVDDAEFGSLRLPFPAADDKDDSTTIILVEGQSVSIATATLHQFLKECLELLGISQREVIRLRYRLLSEAELGSMSVDEVTTFINEKLSSADIARIMDFASEQVVNSRNYDGTKSLKKCILGKILLDAGQ